MRLSGTTGFCIAQDVAVSDHILQNHAAGGHIRAAGGSPASKPAGDEASVLGPVPSMPLLKCASHIPETPPPATHFQGQRD